MKKNPEQNFGTIEVDPLSGEYYIKIPEWMMDDLSWYEDTDIQILLEGNEILLRERNDE